jgi:hypothetical protein
MSREHRRSRWLIAALTALLWGSLGISCEDIIGPPDDSGLPASLRLAADQRVFPHLGGFAAFVDVIVTTDQPFQAVNLEVSWDSDAVSWAEAFPHPEFDDDGVLFGDTQFSAKSLSNIVDLRHGDGAPSGAVRVARVTFVSDRPDPVEIRVLGDIAAPDGTLFSVVISEFATVAP